jgi:hypothetical protein
MIARPSLNTGFHVTRYERYLPSLLIGIALLLPATESNADDAASPGQAGVSAGVKYYFSSSTGSDANNCLSEKTACASISKVNALSYHGGDTIAFRAGDTWTLTDESVNFLGANSGQGRQNVFSSASARMSIATYGDGNCAPIAGIASGCATFKLDQNSPLTVGIELANLSNVLLHNVVVLGGTPKVMGFQSGSGIDVKNNAGAGSGITVQNVEVEDFATLIYIAKLGGSLSKVSILDNYLAGTSPAQTVDNGIWLRFGVTDSTIQGNLVENIGAHDSSAKGFYPGGTGNGILIADGASYITDQFNVTRVIGANYNACGGPVGNWTYHSNNIIIQFNESYFVEPFPYRGGCDWDGFDLDAGVSHSVEQFNYSHDNFGSGYGNYIANAGAQKWEYNTVRFNISRNDNANNKSAMGAIYVGGSTNLTTHSAIYDNTIASNWDEFSSGYCLNVDHDNDIIFASNICYNNGRQGKAKLLNFQVDAPSMKLVNNDYWRVNGGPGNPIWIWHGANYGTLDAYRGATAQDNDSLTSDPGFASPDEGGTCLSPGAQAMQSHCPGGYLLKPDSALIGRGRDLTRPPYGLNVGPKDFYGNTIPHSVGSGYNIGAYGGSPGEH